MPPAASSCITTSCFPLAGLFLSIYGTFIACALSGLPLTCVTAFKTSPWTLCPRCAEFLAVLILSGLMTMSGLGCESNMDGLLGFSSTNKLRALRTLSYVLILSY
jgi:hypothetical protein